MSAGRSSVPRITVVNDSTEFLELMQELLGDAGYEVTTIRGDETSIDGIAASAPDLLVIDLRLGGVDPTGWDVALMARVHDLLREVPIVICSADADGLRQRNAEMSALADVHVLAKPFGGGDAEDLVGRLIARG
ncbi:MAG: response regulator [Chloroflexota bacterium]|nr:response regulator [Chloroflexota bacterium]